jgi:hypothetical protein
MQRTVASSFLHEALQHLQHDASCCIFSFRGWSSHQICSAAQHLLGAAFAAVGGTPKGVYPLGAAEMLHYPTCTISSTTQHAANAACCSTCKKVLMLQK